MRLTPLAWLPWLSGQNQFMRRGDRLAENSLLAVIPAGHARRRDEPATELQRRSPKSRNSAVREFRWATEPFPIRPGYLDRLLTAMNGEAFEAGWISDFRRDQELRSPLAARMAAE
jgi:hypothetical protein